MQSGCRVTTVLRNRNMMPRKRQNILTMVVGLGLIQYLTLGIKPRDAGTATAPAESS